MKMPPIVSPQEWQSARATFANVSRAPQTEIEFEEVEGATTVRFTHNGLLDIESVRNHEEGWNCCFDNLEGALATEPR